MSAAAQSRHRLGQYENNVLKQAFEDPQTAIYKRNASKLEESFVLAHPSAFSPGNQASGDALLHTLLQKSPSEGPSQQNTGG
jgi:hypothetical protein